MEANNNQAPNFSPPQPNFEAGNSILSLNNNEAEPTQERRSQEPANPTSTAANISLPVPSSTPSPSLHPPQTPVSSPKTEVANNEDEPTKRAVAQIQSVVAKTSGDPYQENELINHIKSGYMSQQHSVNIKTVEDS